MLDVTARAPGRVAFSNKRELTISALVLVLVISIFGFFKVASSQPCEGITGPSGAKTCVAATNVSAENRIFGRKNIPSGSDVWHKDGSVRALAVWYSTVAYVIVVGISVLSSRPRKGV